jgi:ribosome maturation factor RimP
MTPETLIQRLSELIAPLGYEVVYLELLNTRQRVLRLFIDFLEETPGRSVGIEDCVKVTKALDEPLETLPDLQTVFGGQTYELEVSSPGIDRPLRTERDYQRFTGKTIRVHVFRPLTAEELENPAYQSKNPKQKKFVGVLQGLENQGRIRLKLDPMTGPQPAPVKGRKVAKPKSKAEAPAEVVTIPLPLVSKANLEPDFTDLTPAEPAQG